MQKIVLLAVFVCAVSSLPLDAEDLRNEGPAAAEARHSMWRRFINPLFSGGRLDTDDIVKIRARRSYDECEKLQLCKLHARSHRSFFAAYELYFVNKENARLWDHQSRSMADCEERYGDCYKK